MLNFRDFIQVYVFSTNHHLNLTIPEQVISLNAYPVLGAPSTA